MLGFGFLLFNCQYNFEHLVRMTYDISVCDQILFSTKRTPQYIENDLNINYFILIQLHVWWKTSINP